MSAPDSPLAAGAGKTVLGIDTSTAATAVCVERADGELFEEVPDVARLLAPPAHARELMPAVLAQMRAAEVGFADLDWLAVGIGPGAYTGLRIGLATARALGQAHGIPVRPVGSLAALAAGIDAPVALALIDARRGELFAALHVDAEERWAPFVTAPDALVERLASARRAGLASPLAAGDGSLRFRHALEAASVEVAPAGSRRHVVRALHVCRLAASAPALAPEAVLPTYLRSPDARPR
jgi:tRNA threonylcarbamoyladenosine biosynthesis protein TsaB